MSSRASLKAALATGQTITQAKLYDVIDSLAHASEDALATDAELAAVSAAINARLLAASNLADLANAATARTNLGAQATLVSTVNIKTVNGTSLLGGGDLVVSGGGTSTGQGPSLQQAIGSSTGTLVVLGDSNTVGRNGYYFATQREWRNPKSPGPFTGWSIYLTASSGTQAGGTVVGSIVSGDQNAAPIDCVPAGAAFDGNIWRVVNAFAGGKSGIIIFNLGINDFGLTAAVRASLGFSDHFRDNVDAIITFLLAQCPNVHIVMDIPAPFVGEDWFIGPTNWTEWATDAPVGEPTIDGGAAAASAEIQRVYKLWNGRSSRVSVFDSTELYGKRIDDKAVNAQDPEGQGPLMDDSLHVSDLGQARHVQRLSRFLFGPSLHRQTTGIPWHTAARQDAWWGEWFNQIQADIAGTDFVSVLSAQPASLWTGADSLLELRTSVLPVSRYELDRSEEYFYETMSGAVKRLTNINGPVKIWFPDTNSTYSATAVSLYQTTTTIYGDTRYSVRFVGVDYATMNAADKLQGARFYAYVESQAAMPFASKQLSFALTNDGGGIENPYPDQWVAKRFFFARGGGANAITVQVSIINQPDGRMVDALLGANANFPGYLVANGTFASYVNYGGELTVNTTGTGNPGSVGFANGVIMKPGYKLIAQITSGTLVGSGSISVSTK